MNKPTIDKPMIFISYAWGSKEYQEKVLSFSRDLVNVGIDVLLDKWSLKEGNDTYSFMEQSVTDTNITNVLILLDEQYEKKANERSGGVGTETQIISPEIYTKVKQDKFIPIVFERGVNNEIYKPAYLKNLLHFDLTIKENYNDEFQRLVLRLFGIEVYQKPKLGNKPSWLYSNSNVSTKSRIEYSVFQSNLSNHIKTEQYRKYLCEMKDNIINFKSNEDNINITESHVLIYDELKAFRDEFLYLLQYISYIENGSQVIANSLEEIRNYIYKNNDIYKNIKLSRLHELFIYLIAFYYKNNNYNALSYILGKTYFNDTYNDYRAMNYNIFHNRDYDLDKAINDRDNKTYYSGTAQYWIDNINTDICTRNELIFADLLCYNYAIFGKNYQYKWYWFPLLYVYGGDVNQEFRSFVIKMLSLENLINISIIFGYENVDNFRNRILEIEDAFTKGIFNEYRYNDSFETAPTLFNFIKTKELGIYR